jgi:DinB superfamily
MPAAERAALIAKIARLPDQVQELVAGLSPAQLTTPFLAGEWTVAQNVHHLVDSHANSYIRCKLILTEDGPPLKPYNQDAWAALPDASGPDVELSLAILRGLHARWVRFWESLPDDAWAREGHHPEYGTMSLDRVLRSYAEHGEAHLDQIGRTLAAQG